MPQLFEDPDVVAVSDPNQIGSDAYNQQVARAQQPTDAESADIDWERVQHIVNLRIHAAQQQAKAQEQAMRFAGQREYEQLISGGATPQEALRRTAHKLYFNSPGHLTSALRYTQPVPPPPTQIQAVPIMGPEGKQVGMGIPNPRGGVHLVTQPRTAAPKMSEADRRELILAKKEMDGAQTKLDAVSKAISLQRAARIVDKKKVAALEIEAAALQPKLKAAQDRYRSIGIDPSAAPAAAQEPSAQPLPDSQEKLQANVTYSTPKGIFTWTGTGWKKPAADQMLEVDDAEGGGEDGSVQEER